jgi:2-polyprenyl-3-methyl-5-hydroxy-6-metoxy-1,4-benzoquinol methylase
LDPDSVLKEIHRVLKDDGYAIISTPNLASLHNRVFLLLGMQPTTIAPSTKIVFGNPMRGADSRMRGPARHITAFTHKSLREMLQHYNFEIEKFTGSGFYPFKGWFAEILAKLLPNFAVYTVVRIKKK